MSIEILQSDCKRAVSNLNSLSNNELDAIMNDDEKIQEIIAQLDQVRFINPLQICIKIILYF